MKKNTLNHAPSSIMEEDTLERLEKCRRNNVLKN